MLVMKNCKIKILVSYHKKDCCLKDEILTPINAGRAVAINTKKNDLDWLIDNCIGDDTGINISAQNGLYNEMTSIYWAWNNYEELGNPDYIGHFHYRRHLSIKEYEKSVIEAGNIDDFYLNDVLGYSVESVNALCGKYDMIIPKPQWRASAYEHFKRNFDISELDEAVNIIHKIFPEYDVAVKEYLDNSKLYFCNIFIMKKDIFFEYCDFIFKVLKETENRVDFTDKRMYISEWITGIFMQKKINENVKVGYRTTVTAQAPITIPVAVSFDHNYVLQGGVTISSLLHSAKSTTSYDVRCIIDDSVTELDKKKIESVFEGQLLSKVQFCKVDNAVFSAVNINTQHITKASFYRLMMADLMPDLDKVIYLDVDLIVCDDLTVMYRYALDNNYIAGVRAPGYYEPETWRNEKLSELKIPSMNYYINAGVLIMNLALIRKDSMQDKFIALMGNNYRSEDQDVLNTACYGQIKILPFRFNVQTKYFEKDNNERYKLEKVIPVDEINDAINNPVIIHYANPEKPWKNIDVFMADKWIESALISKFDLTDVHGIKIYNARKKGKEIDKTIEYIDEINKRGYINYSELSGQISVGDFEVSVIIPCFNVETTISETIKSCLLQEKRDVRVEILCIDDGSSDNTLSVLLEWSRQYPNIRVFGQGNKGSGAARNVGLLNAKGKYIAFMDADDYYPSYTVLDNLYHSAIKNGVSIAGGGFLSVKDGKISSNYCFPLDGYMFNERKIINYSDYQFDFGYTRFIYERKLIIDNNISFPNYLRYQDPPFFVRAMDAAGKFFAVKEASYIYRIGHKKVQWNEEKICHFMDGIKENLLFSKERRYSKLHFYTYLRIKDNFQAICELVESGHIKVFVKFYEMVSEVDYDLLRRSDNYSFEYEYLSSKEEFIDKLCNYKSENVETIHFPKKTISNTEDLVTLHNKIDELNYIICETRKSFSYRIGLLITAFPRKLRSMLKKDK